MFSLGLGIQVTIKSMLNLKRIIHSPKVFKSIFIKKEILNLAVCLGGFSGLFRVSVFIFNKIMKQYKLNIHIAISYNII